MHRSAGSCERECERRNGRTSEGGSALPEVSGKGGRDTGAEVTLDALEIRQVLALCVDGALNVWEDGASIECGIEGRGVGAVARAFGWASAVVVWINVSGDGARSFARGALCGAS